MDETKIDLYVVARAGRPVWLKQTIESARRLLEPKPRQIHVVSPVGEPGMLDGRGAVGFAAGDIPVLKTLPPAARDGLFRQFLRWAVARFVETPAYMVMDSGSALTAPCKLLDEHGCVLPRENLFHFPDYRMHNWLFGKYPSPGGWFVEPTMVFDRKIVTEILSLIEKRYGNVRWFDAVLNILNGVPNTRFRASQAYGGYLETFHADRLRCHPCEHLRLPAESGACGQAPVITLDSDDPTPAEYEKPVLRMSTLGVNGRFGNQLFQYGFLRLFAQDHGMESQTPPWIGQSLFGHRDRFGPDPLPLWCEQDGEMPADMRRCGPRPAGHELWGYFQHHTSFCKSRQFEFRSLFRPLEHIRAPLDEAIKNLSGPDRTLIGLHLRRGDFTGGPQFLPAPTA